MSPENNDLRRQLDKELLETIKLLPKIEANTANTLSLCERLEQGQRDLKKENKNQWRAINKNTIVTTATKWFGAALLAGGSGGLFGFWGEIRAAVGKLLGR